MKTYIIFDTNVLFIRDYKNYSDFVIDSIFDDIQGKIERHDVTDRFEQLIPEITISELFQKQTQAYKKEYEEIKKIYKKFEHMYSVDLVFESEFEYEKFIEEKKQSYILRKGIKILPICGEGRFHKIVERALDKKAPFEGVDKQSDKGFKDALIWESMLEFAEKNEGTYLFFTGDKRFKGELELEFKDFTGNKIFIYGKDEKQKLDIYIEEHSSEKNLKKRLAEVNKNVMEVSETFLNDFKKSAFEEIVINGIAVSVIDFNIDLEVVDLNEAGEELFKFKLNGKAIVNQPGLVNNHPGVEYELFVRMDFLVKVHSVTDAHISYITLDSVEVYTNEGSFLNIAQIEYEFNSSEFEAEELLEEQVQEEQVQEDQVQEDQVQEDQVQEEQVQEDQVQEDQVQEEQVQEDQVQEDQVHERDIQKIDELKIKFVHSLAEVMGSESNDEKIINLAENILGIFKNNIVVDWSKKASIHAKIRVEIKKFLMQNRYSLDQQQMIINVFSHYFLLEI